MVLPSLRSATPPRWKLESSEVAMMVPSLQCTKGILPTWTWLARCFTYSHFNTPTVTLLVDDELVSATTASLVTLAFKPEEGRFATWMVVGGTVYASCTVSPYNGTTAMHYLPISVFVPDSDWYRNSHSSRSARQSLEGRS